MKAPDKIYIPQHNIEAGTIQELVELIVEGSVEYIRKDALLKIIETARESAIIQRNFNNCPVEQEARIDAYDYIKHEIESL